MWVSLLRKYTVLPFPQVLVSCSKIEEMKLLHFSCWKSSVIFFCEKAYTFLFFCLFWTDFQHSVRSFHEADMKWPDHHRPQIGGGNNLLQPVLLHCFSSFQSLWLGQGRWFYPARLLYGKWPWHFIPSKAYFWSGAGAKMVKRLVRNICREGLPDGGY